MEELGTPSEEMSLPVSPVRGEKMSLVRRRNIQQCNNDNIQVV